MLRYLNEYKRWILHEIEKPTKTFDELEATAGETYQFYLNGVLGSDRYQQRSTCPMQNIAEQQEFAAGRFSSRLTAPL